MVMVIKEKLGLAFLLLLLIGIFSTPAHAQFTNVSAIVQDANGNLYPNCSYSVDYVYAVGSSQNPLINGSPFQMSYGGAKCDSFAAFSIRLPDNNSITPLGSKWRFSICDSTGTKCFTSSIPITGASQNITATLSAVAPVNSPIPNAVVKNPLALQTIVGFGLSIGGPSSTAGITDSGPSAFNGNNTFTGVNSIKNMNAIRYAANFPGTDAGAKIISAISDLPSTGGPVSTCGLEGAQSWATTVTVTKNNVKLELCPATFTYSVVPVVVQADNFEFIGHGDASILKAANASNINSINLYTDGASHTGLYIHNFQIDGNAANQTLNTFAIQANTAGGSITNFRIEDMFLHDHKRQAGGGAGGNEIQINVSGSGKGIITHNRCLNHSCAVVFGSDITIENNVATNSDDDAFGFVGGSGLPVGPGVISGNTINGTTAGACIDVINGRGLTITGNVCRSAFGKGILLFDNGLGAGNFTQDSSVIGNTVNGAGVDGINVQCIGCVISGNTSKNNVGNGIAVNDNSVGVLVGNNTVKDNGTGGGGASTVNGIEVANATDVLIAGNIATDDAANTNKQQNGVYVGGGSSTRVYAINNVMQGNIANGYLFAAGTSEVATGNCVNNVCQTDTRSQSLPALNATVDFLRLLQLNDGGTCATPAVAFNAQTTTGIARTGSGQISFCANGSAIFNMVPGGLAILSTNMLTLGDATVGTLGAASWPPQQIGVHDSTAITTEGQTCVGGGVVKAIAISNGTIWKCF